MVTRIKTAVIGVGKMGALHARIFSEVSELVAVVDKNEELAKQTAKKFSCKAYNSYENLLREEKIDAVSVVVPTVFHYQVATFFLDKKIPVLLEKPISNDLIQAKRIIDRARENKVLLMVGHLERFNPAVIKLKQMIKKGEIGQISNIIARRVGGFAKQIRDVNIAVDLAIHDIDIVNYLLDEYPRLVISDKRKVLKIEQEDAVEFFLKYQNATALIQANWITPVKIRKLNITGSKGYLELDYINQEIIFYENVLKKYQSFTGGFSNFISDFAEPKKRLIKITKREPLKEEIITFLKLSRKKELRDNSHALEALRIALH